MRQSYYTGDIASQFINPDTGELAPELQEMYDFFEQDSDLARDMADYQRAMAYYASSQGHSINSGYYSEVIGNVISEQSIAIADQVANVMLKDMEDQWRYISNSMMFMAKEAGQDIDTAAFNDQMEAEWEALQEEFRQNTDLLSQQAAEQSAATFGDIFSGILSAILTIGMGAII
jgi:hypothetical protein